MKVHYYYVIAEWYNMRISKRLVLLKNRPFLQILILNPNLKKLKALFMG